MRVVCISDTHGLHAVPYFPAIPDGDVLIHAGDLTMFGTLKQVRSVFEWLEGLPHKHKIVIAGNHDFSLDPSYVDKRFTEEEHLRALSYIPDNIHYLNDSGISIDGINFWGSPVQPFFCNWAFNRSSRKIQRHWELIPETTHILITHGPPAGTQAGWIPRDQKDVGCKNLALTLNKLQDLKLVVCGHIHEGYGKWQQELDDREVTIVNASICDVEYFPNNPPIIFDL